MGHLTVETPNIIDRFINEGKYGNSVSESLQDLTKFLARAYRRFYR
jgi:hypothetical protein